MDVIQLHAAAESLLRLYQGRRLQSVTGTANSLGLRFGPLPQLCLVFEGQFRGMFPLHEEGEGNTSSSCSSYLYQRLAGFSLETIEHPWPDRILLLRFTRKRLTGNYDRRCLVAEFLGRHCNLILLTGEGRIDRPFQRLGRTDIQARLVPGIEYRPPPLPLEHKAQHYWNLLEGPPPEEWELDDDPRELVCSLVPLPPRLEEAMEGLAHQQRRDLLEKAARALTQPTEDWCLHPDGQAAFLYPFPLPNREGVISAGPLEHAWPHFLEPAIHRARQQQQRQRLHKRLGTLRKRLTERLEKVHADEERHSDPGLYRRYGQALLSLGAGVARQSWVVATDYFSSPPAPIEVPIQVDHPYQEEAERYFNRARKAERGQRLAARRRRETEDDLAEVERLEADLADEADEATLEAIADRLDRLEEIPAEQRHSSDKTGSDEARAPQVYTYRGYSLLVGHSSRGNDQLTFRQARPWDLWFHVQGLPGAHVVLWRNQRNSLPEEEVLDYAARLAVTHSPKAGPKAEVDWTEVKYVRRHPKGKPGQALYTHFRTRIATALPESSESSLDTSSV